jgi:protein O-mannosyl-transferase
VAWIAERKDVLSTLFALLAIWAYASYVRRPRSEPYIASLVFFALGLMAKSMVVTLPVLLLLLDFWPLGRIGSVSFRRLLIEKTPFVALSAASSTLAFLAVSTGGAVSSLGTVPFGLRVANALSSYWYYVQSTLWPSALAVFYPFPAEVPTWTMLAGAFLVVGVAVCAWQSRRRHPYALTGWLWYVVALVPVIGVVQVGGHARTDHFMYLPILGLFITAAWGASALAARWRIPTSAEAVGGVVVVIGFAIAAAEQLEHWRTSVALWQRAVAATPENHRARSNLGVSLMEEGRTAEAVTQIERAVVLAPGLPEPRNNLGLALERLGRRDEALAQYAAAIAADPNYAEAHNNLGAALMNVERVDEALGHLREAVGLRPDYGLAHYNLGAALARKEQLEDALRQFERAIDIDPTKPAWHCSAGLAASMLGRGVEASGHLNRSNAAATSPPQVCRALRDAVNK